MKILRAYKTELDPNSKQRTLFLQYAGAARFVYNWALADRIERYKHGEKSNLYEQKRRFNTLKKTEFSWLDGIAYTVTESAFANLDRSYQNFFRRVRRGGEKVGFPKFKSRKQGIGSFTVRGCLHICQNRVKLPNIGWVRVKEQGYLPVSDVKILSMNISERAGRWFVSVQIEQEVANPIPAKNKPLGIDVGIKTLATLSNGKVFANPKTLYHHEVKLAHLQRELCRRRKGSKNREKTKVKVQCQYAKIVNIRRWYLHQVSNYVTVKTKPSIVVLEDLNVKGMMANKHIAKSVADASFSELARQIQYKAQWNGIDVVMAGRFYPSSKTCSACGTIKPVLTLNERTFVCHQCGMILDRDINAAMNLASLAVKPTVSACGGDKNLVPCELSPVKQELSTQTSLRGNPQGFAPLMRGGLVPGGVP